MGSRDRVEHFREKIRELITGWHTAELEKLDMIMKDNYFVASEQAANTYNTALRVKADLKRAIDMAVNAVIFYFTEGLEKVGEEGQLVFVDDDCLWGAIEDYTTCLGINRGLVKDKKLDDETGSPTYIH